MIPQVAKNFLNSEKGVMALALLIGATVLAAMGQMSVEAWQTYSIWIFGIYTGGKSIQGAAAHLAGNAPGGQIAAETDDTVTDDDADDANSDEPKDAQS